MSEQPFNLFFTLLRLKSYLISLIDDPEKCNSGFYFSEEYLERCFPERKEEIISLLRENGIENDCDIAFNHSIQAKFKEIAKIESPSISLKDIFNEMDVDAENFLAHEIALDEIISERESDAIEIIKILFQLSKNWAAHKNVQNEASDFLTLDEEDLLRGDEMNKLENLIMGETYSFQSISELSKQYIMHMAQFFFKHGGDISLNKFIEFLRGLPKEVSKKYSNLFKDHGLDSKNFTE